MNVEPRVCCQTSYISHCCDWYTVVSASWVAEASKYGFILALAASYRLDNIIEDGSASARVCCIRTSRTSIVRQDTLLTNDFLVPYNLPPSTSLSAPAGMSNCSFANPCWPRYDYTRKTQWNPSGRYRRSSRELQACRAGSLYGSVVRKDVLITMSYASNIPHIIESNLTNGTRG